MGGRDGSCLKYFRSWTATALTAAKWREFCANARYKKGSPRRYISVSCLRHRGSPCVGLEELAGDPNKVRCLPCRTHVFGASPFQRKSVKRHVNSQAHQRAVRAAASAKEEELKIRARNRRLDRQALGKAEANRFKSSLSKESPMKRPPAPQTFVYHGETLREEEIWARFKTDGSETGLFGGDDVDEDEVVDAALRRFQTINDASTSASLDPQIQVHVSPTMITVRQRLANVMSKIGNTSTQHWQ